MKGYVHVWEEESAARLMRELDTISDLLRYLRWKEDLIALGNLSTAASESDLLGYYMYHREEASPRDSLNPPVGSRLTIADGSWKLWADSPLRVARHQANAVSYVCDHLINQLAEQTLRGNTIEPVENPYGTVEKLLRQLALEPRLVRRALATAWLEVVNDRQFAYGGFRLVGGIGAQSAYGLLSLPRLPGMSEDQYRKRRCDFLTVYMSAAMSLFTPPVHLIGIATEPSNPKIQSVDAMYYDPTAWNDQAQEMGRETRRRLGILQNVHQQVRFTVDSPGSKIDRLLKDALPKSGSLNGPCPCGKPKTF